MKIQKLNEWVNTDDQKIVDEIISKFKSFDLDGETMQQILVTVGMDIQMLSQLSRSYPKQALNEIIDACEDNPEIIDDIESFLLYKMTNHSTFYEKIKDIMLKIDAKKYNII